MREVVDEDEDVDEEEEADDEFVVGEIVESNEAIFGEDWFPVTEFELLKRFIKP